MNLILSTQNLTSTESIETHIRTCLEKLEHIDHQAINARVTIGHDTSESPEKRFSCSIRLEIPGNDLFAEDAESDMHAAIDLVTKKVQQQLRKRHSKFKARNHSEAAREKVERQESNL